MESTATETQVFFLNPRDGWAMAAFDAEGNQVGEAMIVFHKRDALREAQLDYDHLPCRVFTKDGREQRTIPATSRMAQVASCEFEGQDEARVTVRGAGFVWDPSKGSREDQAVAACLQAVSQQTSREGFHNLLWVTVSPA